MQNMIFQGVSLSGHERNCCYLNTGSGRFANVSAVSGLDFMDDARAHALVDWDHDGDLDLWSANRTTPPVRFLRNGNTNGNGFVALRLQGNGTTTNRDAIGARVEVILANGGGRTAERDESEKPKVESRKTKLIKSLRAGEGFLGQSSKWLHFGLGTATEIERVVVRWPGAEPEDFTGLEAGGFFELVQAEGVARRWQPPDRTVRITAAVQELPRQTRHARVLLTSRLALPPLECETLDGERILLSDHRPGPLLLNLWATWCQPCVVELKEFSDHRQALRQAGLDVLALSVDSIDEDHPSDTQLTLKFVEQFDFPFRVGIATAELIDQLQILHNGKMVSQSPLPVPASFLIDAHGRLAAIYQGPVSIERLLADVEMLSLDENAWKTAALPLPGHWYQQPNLQRLSSHISRLIEQGYVETGLKTMDQNRESLSADEHLSLGILLDQQGWHAEAMAEYQTARQLDPSLAKAHVNFGVSLQRLGKVDEAIAAFREAVQLDPKLAVAQMNLGVFEASAGRRDEAERRYRAAIQSDPTLTMAHMNLGVILENNGQLAEAASAYQEAIRLNPDLAEAHLRLGKTFALQNRLTKTLAAYREAVRVDPQLTVARVRLAAVLKELGRTGEAIAAYREVLRMDPELPMAQNNLAWILATHFDPMHRDGAQAVRLAEQAARATQFKRTGVLDTLAAAYAEAGRFEDAVRTVKQAIDLARSRGNSQAVAELESHLSFYQQGHAFRTPQHPTE